MWSYDSTDILFRIAGKYTLRNLQFRPEVIGTASRQILQTFGVEASFGWPIVLVSYQTSISNDSSFFLQKDKLQAFVDGVTLKVTNGIDTFGNGRFKDVPLKNMNNFKNRINAETFTQYTKR